MQIVIISVDTCQTGECTNESFWIIMLW